MLDTRAWVFESFSVGRLMVLGQDKYFAEAVFFFEGNQVVKEILYVEFQAVLESVVGIPEYAKKECRAAYITVGSYLTLSTVVLFNIRFDKHGHVIKEWDLPLHALTRNAVAGPDLGQGNILLVTQKTCENEYKNSLWDADKHELAVLTSIRDSVKEISWDFMMVVTGVVMASMRTIEGFPVLTPEMISANCLATISIRS